jgi:hypothetical protein
MPVLTACGREVVVDYSANIGAGGRPHPPCPICAPWRAEVSSNPVPGSPDGWPDPTSERLKAWLVREDRAGQSPTLRVAGALLGLAALLVVGYAAVKMGGNDGRLEYRGAPAIVRDGWAPWR